MMGEPNIEQSNDSIDYSTPIGQGSAGGQWKEMTPANPVPTETAPDQEFSGDRTGLQGAADEVVARREETKQERQAKAPVERAYQRFGGEQHGERIPSHESVTPEQAAHDLQTIRDAEQAQELDAIQELLRNEVDGVRGVQTTEALGVEPQAGVQEQPVEQPIEQQAQHSGVDPEVARLIESNPKLQQALRAEIQQRDAIAFQALQSGQQAIENAGQMALANVLTNFPELANVPVNQLGTALQVMQGSNPERAQAARQHLEHVGRMAAAVDQNRQQQIAAQQAGFKVFAEHSDKAYEKWIETTAPGRADEISKAAKSMLNDLGWTAETIAHEWNGNSTFRSAQGQVILALAAQTWQARKNLPSKVVRQIPAVQRPGSGGEFTQRADFSNQREALAKLDKTGSVKAAADYLIAKRAAARRG